MKVYCLESVYGDGDSNAGYDLVNVFGTETSARAKACEMLVEINKRYNNNLDYGIINDKMTKENDYCILSKLGDRLDTEGAEYSRFGGFVIYEVEVKP